MFWFIMCVNESIESTHCEHVRFQGLNSMALFTFKNKFCSSSSRFGTRIVSTVILTNYECTHKATTRQSVWNRFYWQSKTPPPRCAHFGTKSYNKSLLYTRHISFTCHTCTATQYSSYTPHCASQTTWHTSNANTCADTHAQINMRAHTRTHSGTQQLFICKGGVYMSFVWMQMLQRPRGHHGKGRIVHKVLFYGTLSKSVAFGRTKDKYDTAMKMCTHTNICTHTITHTHTHTHTHMHAHTHSHMHT